MLKLFTFIFLVTGIVLATAGANDLLSVAALPAEFNARAQRSNSPDPRPLRPLQKTSKSSSLEELIILDALFSDNNDHNKTAPSCLGSDLRLERLIVIDSLFREDEDTARETQDPDRLARLLVVSRLFDRQSARC